MNYQQYLNNPSTQAFLLAAFFIYFIFRVFHFLNKRFVLKQSYRKNLRKFIYLLEFLTWLIFLLEAINFFAENNIVLAGSLALILFIITGWTTWFVIKDYVAGLYLKWNNAYKANEVIEIDGQSGRILKLEKRSLLFEISPLHTTQIAYSKLFTKKVIKTGLTDLGANASFTIDLLKEFQNAEGLTKIHNYIFQLPWTNLKHQPLVVVENQESEKMIVRISASLIEESYIDQFRNAIKEKFE